ncbi:MAG: ATP-binding cassette domain-containing protein [Tannerella sp.]|jgi:molybdate transport system ATP-binding protein|nr:ATP-binding cassette domain-containing protein [Tannerella sp.]
MITIENAVPANSGINFREPVSLHIRKGEQTAFVGRNGSGKSMLAKLALSHFPLREGKITYSFSPQPVYENAKMISFRDVYGAVEQSYYLQQRWNSQDRELSPLVTLSSGELRKYQINKILQSRPKILVIDNPFIGLDAASRVMLAEMLNNMALAGETQIILLLSKTDEIPDFITHIVPVEDMRCGIKIRRAEYRETPSVKPKIGVLEPPSPFVKINFFSSSREKDVLSENVVVMKDITVRYGSRTILANLNWTVRRGERWALLGPNGSGKSTLLSIVCADNPQSYACDVSLFGRRRGTGESIWDIKRRIGYVSPEMHRAYYEDIPAIKIVASGLYDSVGLYLQPKEEEYAVCEWWMNLFGVKNLKDRHFMQLSDGEQRLILLARAFVKDPELLILDEPMHGLDTQNRLKAGAIIESFCQNKNKTLIMVTHYEKELPESITNQLVL